MLNQIPDNPTSNCVTQFRARREGPEAVMQDVVVNNIPELFSPKKHCWAGASIPLGAGIPDLVVVSYNPQVFSLSNVDLADAQILAYLRAVGKARLSTIAERMRRSPEQLSGRLYQLVDAEAVAETKNTFSLSPAWRQILPDIITVEIKISNWQRAVEQAARNRIFAHASFIALPEKVAQRIRTEQVLAKVGIGLISVGENGVATTIRKPRRSSPTVWTYYYQLASILARSHFN